MKKIVLAIGLSGLLSMGCEEKKTGAAAADTVTGETREKLLETYSQVPEASVILQAGDSGMAVYAICKQRYADQLTALKKEADAIGAKLVVTILSPEIGESVTKSTREGIPFIMETAAALGLEAYDLTTPLAGYTAKQITQMPLDGHWSAGGSKIVAALYQPLIAAAKGVRSSKTFTDAERPATFGDLDPDQDVALDGGKNIPYQLITNSQGLRMKTPLVFPKTKQRVLLLGDSQVYSPFLDNDQIFTNLLQEQFPDTEIMNAGVIGYTLDDCVGLLAEKAKFSEPDLIILVTNPNDIGDFYFTQRNRMARSKKAFVPTATETALYQQLFGEKTK
jgi:hypothetical protein